MASSRTSGGPSGVKETLTVGDDVEFNLRFDREIPPTPLFTNYITARVHLTEVLERTQSLLQSRRDSGRCNKECAVAATKVIYILKKMLTELDNGDQTASTRDAMDLLLSQLGEARRTNENVLWWVERRQNEVNWKRWAFKLVTFFILTLFLPVFIGVVAPQNDAAQLIARLCPYFFGITWGWSEDRVKKELLELKDWKETTLWVRKAIDLVPTAVEDSIIKFMPQPTPTPSTAGISHGY